MSSQNGEKRDIAAGEDTAAQDFTFPATDPHEEGSLEAGLDAALELHNREETLLARAVKAEAELKAAVDTVTALRWCPPGSYCTTVSGSRIGMMPECHVCIRDYLMAKGKGAVKTHGP